MDFFECPFSSWAKRAPTDIALLSEEGAWSYLECHELIEAISLQLKKRGVKEGMSIGILPFSSPIVPLLFFALFRLGAIASPLNRYNPREVILEQLRELSAPFLIAQDDVELEGSSIIPFSSLQKREKVAKEVYLKPCQRATYLWTSGTTNKPKIACHSLENHWTSALGSNAFFPIHQHDRYHLSLPLYHVSGIAILFRTFLNGATLSLLNRGITHTSMVPTMLYRLMKSDEPKRAIHILLGGSQIAPALYLEALSMGLKVYPTYGMTEMSSQITTHPSLPFFSLGHPLPDRELKISPEGEILVRGKVLFQGYLQSSGELLLPLNEEGFFATSDRGSYHREKGLDLLGRNDRMFISGGENIQPEEIESHLLKLKGVIHARVKPKEDPEFGSRPVAYLEREKNLTDDEIKCYLKPLLPKYKIPVEFIDQRSTKLLY